MKKLFKLATLLCLVLALSVSAMACSSAYKKIEKALTDIGYSVVESDSNADKMKGESDIAVTVHVLSNKTKANAVIVFEFKATDDMMTFYKESSTMRGFVKDVKDDGTAEEFYNALVEKGIAKGNCMVMSINLFVSQEVYDAVKGA